MTGLNARCLRVFAVAGLAVWATACINVETLVSVKSDGSGTLTETVTMSPEVMKMMESMGKSMAEGMGAKEDPSKKGSKGSAAPTPFSIEEAKTKAGKYGEGVTFVSAEPINKPDAKGLRATYAFKDITKLAISQKPDTPSGPNEGGGPSVQEKPEDRVRFTLTKLPSGNSLLRVNLGVSERDKAKLEHKIAEKTDATKTKSEAPDPAQMAMVKQFFKGMRVAILVRVDGRVVKTNSPYVDGPLVTLLDINFDSLLEDTARMQKLQEAKSMEDFRTLFQGLKGVKVNLDPEVNIEFSKM